MWVERQRMNLRDPRIQLSLKIRLLWARRSRQHLTDRRLNRSGFGEAGQCGKRVDLRDDGRICDG